jgi:hypothetical protein
MSILLVILTIISGLIGGAITGRIFAVKPAMAEETKKAKETLEETVKRHENMLAAIAFVLDHQLKSLTTHEIKVVDENNNVFVKIGKDDSGKTEGYGLYIYDSSGKSKAIMKVNESGGTFSVYGKDSSGAMMMVGEHGGSFTAHDKDGKTRASMDAGESGGSISVSSSKDDKIGVMMSVGDGSMVGADSVVVPYVGVSGKGGKAMMSVIESGALAGGYVSVSGSAGKANAGMSADETGGVVSVSGNAGNAGMSVVESGAGVNISGKGGRAMMIVTEYGGSISVYGKGSDKERASMGVNEYGNGAIGLWDKDGYKLK